jgi:hypothetical protein
MNQYSDLGIHSFDQTCKGCGRTFAHSTAFGNHSASCVPKKKRLANALLAAQELYRDKKRRRLLQGSEVIGVDPLTACPGSQASSVSRTATNVHTYVLFGALPLLLSLIQGSGTSERATSGMECNDMMVADEVVVDERLFLAEHRPIIGPLTASLSGSQASSSSGAATNVWVCAFYLPCSLLFLNII